MSLCGNRNDNAVAESFLSSMTPEKIKKKIYVCSDEARLDLAQYIEGY